MGLYADVFYRGGDGLFVGEEEGFRQIREQTALQVFIRRTIFGQIMRLRYPNA